jgi:hypothetical protein
MTTLLVFAFLPARYVTNIDLDAPAIQPWGSSFMILHTMMIVISRKKQRGLFHCDSNDAITGDYIHGSPA